MSERNWKREYEQALREHAAAPTAAPPGGAVEQRRDPRLQPRGTTVSIGLAPGVHLTHLDGTTVEFLAERRFDPGAPVLLQIETAPPLQVHVLSCALEETDTIWLDAHYRVRCRIDPQAGSIPTAE